MSSSINGPSIFDPATGAIGTGGANGIKGTTPLTAGTVTLSIAGLTSSSVAFVQLLTPAGSLGVNYKCVCSANQLIITSLTTGLGTQVLDTSTVQYFCIQ